jgi:hypothetical protein
LHFGPWLSLVERLVRVEEVAGSNPAGPTTLKINPLEDVGLSAETIPSTTSAQFLPRTTSAQFQLELLRGHAKVSGGVCCKVKVEWGC